MARAKKPLLRRPKNRVNQKKNQKRLQLNNQVLSGLLK